MSRARIDCALAACAWFVVFDSIARCCWSQLLTALQEGRCEVAWRGIQDSEWSQQEVKSGQPVECTSLMPGSKYVFKARTGDV